MKKDKKVYIYGASYTAQLVFEFFTYDSPYEVIGFTVEDKFKKDDYFCGLPVVPFSKVERVFPSDMFHVFVAIGATRLSYPRRHYCEILKHKGYTLTSYVSSQALIWHNVIIGTNCLVLPGTTAQPFSTLGDGVFCWYNTNIGHHSIVNDYCFLASSSNAGFSAIGEHSFIGGQAVIGDHVNIAPRNYIAMGSIVTKNTCENSVYRGNPAQKQPVEATTFTQVDKGSLT